MNISDSNLQFPIRKLSERTGVAATTLRAWERRYGLLRPKRTPKGHRLYNNNDVQLVTRVLSMLKDGHAISEVARQVLETESQDSNNSIVEVSTESEIRNQGRRGGDTQWTAYIERFLRAVEEFNPQGLDAVYNEASSLYPIDLVSQHLIEPMLKSLGDRWVIRDSGIAEEHFFLAWLRNKLGARLHHASSQANGSVIVVACLPGDRHEIGSLLFSLAALGRGYKVVYLGGDMPLDPIFPVVERSEARGVVLSGGRGVNSEKIIPAIRDFASRLSCPLFIGGQVSVEYGEQLVNAGAMPIGEQFALALHLLVSKVPTHMSNERH